MKLCKVKNFQVSRSNCWWILKAFHMLSCIRRYHIWKAPVIPSPSNCKALPDFRNYFVSLFPLALNLKPDKKEHLFSGDILTPSGFPALWAPHILQFLLLVSSSLQAEPVLPSAVCSWPRVPYANSPNPAGTNPSLAQSQLKHHKVTPPPKQPTLLSKACLWPACYLIFYCSWKLSSNLKDLSPIKSPWQQSTL